VRIHKTRVAALIDLIQEMSILLLCLFFVMGSTFIYVFLLFLGSSN